MEFFLWYAMMFFPMAMLVVMFIVIRVGAAYRKKEKLKPIKYLTYNRQHFDRDFEFSCEYCGNKVTTKDINCTQCGGSYGDNEEYKNRKKATDLKYLEFLKEQEEQLVRETKYVEETFETLRKNMIMKNRFFNFELGEMPVFRASASFEFTCEYCSTKLRGKSTDDKTCPNCGAGYSDNLSLLVAEEEEKLEKTHYQEYLTLKDIQWNQNIENIKKDDVNNKRAVPMTLIATLIFFIIVYILAKICYGIFGGF